MAWGTLATGWLGRLRLPGFMAAVPDRVRRHLRVTPLRAALLVAGLFAGVIAWVALTTDDTVPVQTAAGPLMRVAIEQEGQPPAAATDPGSPVAATPAAAASPAASPAPTAAGPSAAPTPAAPPTPAKGVPPPPPPPPLPTSPIAQAPVSLTPAPVIGLVEDTPDGPLPQIGPDGVPPWRVYSRTFAADDKRFRIAVILADIGQRGSTTNQAIEQLPGEVTLSFVPYAERIDTWIETARRRGHEVLLQLPMEPVGYPRNDSGPNSLLVALEPKRNLERLRMALRVAAGYVGVTTLTGSRFLGERRALLPVLEELKHRGLLFVDSGLGGNPQATATASELGVTWARAHLMLDQEPGRTAIDAQLQKLEAIARAEGTAVGIGRPYPSTIERLNAWVRLLPGREIALVPVSAVAGRQQPPASPPDRRS